MIYLDNAATTFPKPETVYDTVDRFQRNYAVNAGRGMYKTARIASDMIGETRKLMADLTKCRDENRVIFSPSATIAMNQVLCGMNYSPDTVVYISPFEHNAVVRPLYRLSKKFGYKQLSVISGVWVREYYKSLWFELKWTYMSKPL